MEAIHEDLVTWDPVPWLGNTATRVYVLRLDRLHPQISGNKWYKLRFYLENAKKLKKSLVTFGGPYSNHILATAAACKLEGIRCAGIIRGEAPRFYSPTLQDAAALGMELHFITREAYRQKQVPPSFSGENWLIVPEGGYGVPGMQGAATIPVASGVFDHICCATGTGTMMAGLLQSASQTTVVTGFSVLKNHQSLQQEMDRLLAPVTRTYTIHHDFHFGGYAKYTSELIRFMNDLYHHTGIPTDFVYTAKLFYGVKALLQQDLLQSRNLLVVHSGGLQGNRSLSKGTLIF
ncbi:pyridoxal-phosphate dependent enzyme [Niabella sp. CC-SYL272]|uniref:1-aminocyclopropane-1-carboxylate deaminase/D-cysteine desulfhydrase n=1 Tax=Niabella agricola TaxID=2891571 RepID=UPI001F28A074|nr:pyridoxal-phosphate dependent enzyme [Niabella agricola]MCF3107235.1 pyridoxal-phosphate dependent enzyme [Niabella agricola]